ncbi:MAG: cofactor assembly of complex C subunit B [Chroococcidiopsidaceae cyanobacterium CP_BM_ER_R8_30]|nr:cofactor assembly of complex C subunit B [Chroococcidiopsidaceae cyanobacterium CP_BM_ER_R8_30]
MNPTIFSSTLLLTSLLSVGLFFFIRASVKERTQEVRLTSEQAQETLIAQLQQYMQERSYQVVKVDALQNQVTFEGFVRPSVFLAIFLSVLAAAGILCLALVLSLLFPKLGVFFLALVLLSPIAGIFYWKRAGRKEQVLLKVEAVGSESKRQSQFTVIAHRDEIIELRKALKL